MEFKVFKNENSKILKEYWLTQSEWDALDKTTVQEGDIYHIVGTIDKGDLSADVNASLAKADSSLQKPTATLAKESFVKVGIDGTQKFDESSYVVAPSTDGTAGQILKKTETGSEWANESGKLYLHKLNFMDTEGHLYYGSLYTSNNTSYTLETIPDYTPITASYGPYRGVGVFVNRSLTLFVTSGSTVEILYEKDVSVADTVTEL